MANEEMNIDDVANDIVDTTLDTIGDQTDEVGKLDLDDSVKINPQAFLGANYMTVRVSFKTPFQNLPRVTFGQAAFGGGRPPFIVAPIVATWSYMNGLVDGFELGIYTITSPPDGVDTHYISWRAVGDASRSGQQATEQSWTDTYNSGEPEFLEADSSDVANQGEDLLDDPIDESNYPY